MVEPAAPDRKTRDKLLAILAELVTAGGAEPLLVEPVKPGPKAFPEPWAPTPSGVALLLRRLATYAGLDHVAASMTDDRATAVGQSAAGDRATAAGESATVARESGAVTIRSAQRSMIVADQRFAN